MEYFLQLGTPGRDQILGKSRDKRHLGWIELLQFSHRSQQGAFGRKSPARLEDHFCIMKGGNRWVSQAIYAAAHSGKVFRSAILSSSSPRVPQIVMKDVIVTSFETLTDETGDVYEVFSLSPDDS